MIGGWGNSAAGFGLIDGWPADQNASSAACELENGHVYIAEVRVRKDSITAYLDGKFISGVATAGHQFSVPRMLSIDRGNLGLATQRGPTVFYSAEIVVGAN